MKTCFKCLEAKPLTEFYPHKQMADGHLNKCKECAKRDVKAAMIKDIEAYRARQRELRNQRPSNAASARAYAKTGAGRLVANAAKAKWIANNSDKRAAHNIFASAIKRGKLEKEPCFVCGCDEAEAHHSAYDLPLHVTWLCDEHHKQVHREHRQYLRDAGIIKPYQPRK